MQAHEFINEVKMSPGYLKSEALKIPATVGIEFEMVVPNAPSFDDDEDLTEPDYSHDERARSIDAIMAFFELSRSTSSIATTLQSWLERNYSKWLEEQLDSSMEQWNKEKEDLITEYYLKNEISLDAEIEHYLRDNLKLSDQQIRTVMRAGTKKSDEDDQEDFFKDADEAHENYDTAYYAVLDEVKNDVDRIIDRQGEIYNTVYDEFMEDQPTEDQSEQDWLSGEMAYMSDVQSTFNYVRSGHYLDWPYYTSTDYGSSDSIESIASNFENAIGRNVEWAKDYHKAPRPKGDDYKHYIIEPDGSIETQGQGGAGLEFISPPLPLNSVIEDLHKVKKWADDNGCYTNDSTGLHCNISLPNYSIDNLDYVKLALLVGDEYVLETFGRMSNEYCISAIQKIKNTAKSSPDQVDKMFKYLHNTLNGIASKLLYNYNTQKFTSINVKPDRIEFRGAGGDYLDKNFNSIEQTIYRFVVALDAALDPAKYRNDYLKKLYKVFKAKKADDNDMLQLFIRHATGEMPTAALKSFLRQAQLERSTKKQASDTKDTTGKKYWWSVTEDTDSDSTYRIEVVALNKDEAIAKAKKETGGSWTNIHPSNFIATLIRPYDDTD